MSNFIDSQWLTEKIGKELVKFKEGDEGDKFLTSILKQGAKAKLLSKKKCLKVKPIL